MKINYKVYSMKELNGLLENLDKKEDSELIAETTHSSLNYRPTAP